MIVLVNLQFSLSVTGQIKDTYQFDCDKLD